MKRMHCPRTLTERIGIDIDGPYKHSVCRPHRAILFGMSIIAVCIMGAACFARW